MRSRKGKYDPVAVRALRSGVGLPSERFVHEHPHHDLRVGLHVAARGVVPDVESRLVQRVVGRVEECHAVHSRFVFEVPVVVFERVDPVVDRFQVLSDEDSVRERFPDGDRFAFQQRRIVLRDRVGFRVVKEDVDVAHRIRRHGVGRVAGHQQRVDVVARRKDVAQAGIRIPLVVVHDAFAEVQRIGLVRIQILLQVDLDTPPPQHEGRFFLHERGGEKLLLLVFELDVFVELDRDPFVFEIGRPESGGHHDDFRRQRVARASLRGADAGAAGQDPEAEKSQDPEAGDCFTDIYFGHAHFNRRIGNKGSDFSSVFHAVRARRICGL